MSNIVTEPTATAQWHALINEAEAYVHQDLGETLESYLVFTLMRFTQRPEMAGRIMATDFLNGLNENGLRRHDELRDVGDQCLLFSGLFPHIARKRLVNISYFVNLGRSAYQKIHDDQFHNAYELYGQLASDFVPMMDVLLAIRELENNQAGLDLIEAFELCETLQSAHACKKINSATSGHSIIPDINSPIH